MTKNETYTVWMLSLFQVLDCARSRYWHWQLYRMFYRPYCCPLGHLLLWFVKTQNSPGPTVEHKTQFVIFYCSHLHTSTFKRFIHHNHEAWDVCIILKQFSQRLVEIVSHKLACVCNSACIYDTGSAISILYLSSHQNRHILVLSS